MKSVELIIIDSMDDLPGIDTLEGKIGPLVSGNKGSMHYIIMPPDMYCSPHTHPTESIIYTVKGEWVLCSGGERHHMKEGSIFYMPPNIETGYEVPFDRPATILISKFEGKMDPDEFLEYLKGLKMRLEDSSRNGVSFRISDLPEGHPSRIFAKKNWRTYGNEWLRRVYDSVFRCVCT